MPTSSLPCQPVLALNRRTLQHGLRSPFYSKFCHHPRPPRPSYLHARPPLLSQDRHPHPGCFLPNQPNSSAISLRHCPCYRQPRQKLINKFPSLTTLSLATTPPATVCCHKSPSKIKGRLDQSRMNRRPTTNKPRHRSVNIFQHNTKQIILWVCGTFRKGGAANRELRGCQPPVMVLAPFVGKSQRAFGVLVGVLVSCSLGASWGPGLLVGAFVGLLVGGLVGVLVGLLVGAFVGQLVGVLVGGLVWVL